MTTDYLLHPEASIFPHSAYVIGLAKVWLFAEPMDIRPFDFAPEGQWRPENGPEASADRADLWRLGAIYVDKILRGIDPTDLPVQQPTKFELVAIRGKAEILCLI